MKNLTTIFFLIFCIAELATAQSDLGNFCGLEDSDMMLMSTPVDFPGDGQHITSHGTLRVLVVFAKFPDDSDPDPTFWPHDGFPNFANTIIDSTESQNSTHFLNVTNYFDQMSLGQYQVIGDVYTVTAPKTYSEYGSRSAANRGVLEMLDTEYNVDFSLYDNWTKLDNYDHDSQPDGVVDMIFMIWRGMPFTTNWTGINSISGNSFNVNDSLTINPSPMQSGFTAQTRVNSTILLNTLTHELGHWLLGGNHPYDSNSPPNNRIWSLLQANHRQAFHVNAAERERLGWITVPEITQDMNNVPLGDYITTGDAYKYKVPESLGGAPNEYIYIENHQKLSVYDDATKNSNDKGIFIFQDQNALMNQQNIRQISSDGDFEWDQVPPDSASASCCGTVPVFGKINHDLSEGVNYTTQMSGNDTNYHWLHGYKNEDNQVDVKGYFRGVDFTGSFTDVNHSLFAPNTNPMPRTWSGDQVPFAMEVVNQSGSEITVNFFTDYDPFTITENTSWDGEIFLHQTTKVENNATLNILPGTTVYLAEDVNLSIRSGLGGKLIAEGTEEDPIQFLRADPNKAWGTIYLNSSEPNSIKWALFDGGSTNLTIASQNNTIEHSTFRNATFRNIDSWHNQDGSGNSSATISHALIETSSTVGIVAQYIDLDMSYTTIKNNNEAGMYITSASVYPFHRNEVINNGWSNRDGVEVMSSGTFYMQNSNLYEGYNEISGNQRHQVSSSGDLIVGTYYPGMGGKNSVHGDHDTEFNYLVKNNSSTTVKAYDIWWGQSTTDTTMFYGPVNTSYFILSSDPTDGEDHGSGGQTPAKALPGNEGEDLPLAEVYDQLESDLEKAETNQQVRDGLHRLYQVAWLAKEESPELSGRFRQLAGQITDGNEVIYTSSRLNATLRDVARVLQGKSLMRAGEYEKADAWLAGQNGQELSGDDRRDWLHLEMDLLRYRGEYQQALEVLTDLYSYESSRGTDMDEFRGFYQPIEEDIAMRLGDDSGQLAEPQKQAEKIAAEVEVTLQNYPNPFNPTTVISYQLPAQSEVRLDIFDMLGRRVAVLVDEAQPAGTYSAEFDASNLASGVYLYRLQTGEAVQTRQMVLVK